MSLKSEINISKLAIITGEAGNMGQALVKKFIKQGHDLVGMVVAGECIPTNHRIEYFEKKTVDILSETEADKFVKEKTASNKKSTPPCSPLVDLQWERSRIHPLPVF